MPDITLVLGGVAFANFEIPPQIEGGGAQALKVHKLLGGARVIDALGRDDEEIVWSGRFQGSNAETRAQSIDQLRIAGQPVTLTWGARSYTVVVASFKWRWERYYQILYSISCTVQDDNTTAPAASNATLDDLVGGDTASIDALTPSVGDPTIGAAVGSLEGAIASVGTLQGASLVALAPVVAAAQAATATIDVALAAEDAATLTDGGSVAGIVRGVFPPTGIAIFTAQAALIAEQAAVQQIGSLVSRIAVNVAQATG